MLRYEAEPLNVPNIQGVRVHLERLRGQSGVVSIGGIDSFEGAELVTEEELLARELDVALKLVVLPANQARMRHMLATNKPLEN